MVASVRRRLPRPVKRGLSGLANAADPISLRWLRARRNWTRPVPPRRIRARMGQPDAEGYVESGRRVAGELEEVLRRTGRALDSFSSVLDFGSGAGRVLTSLAVSPVASLRASDVDHEAISWLAAAFPAIEARPNRARPPTDWAEGSFDLIYAISVFTHLNEDSQNAWLAELTRLARPNGTLVLTVHEASILEAFLRADRSGIAAEQAAALRSRDLAAEGFLFAAEPRSRWDRWRFSGVEREYGLAFHDAGYVRRHWAAWMHVDAIVSDSINWRQSAVVGRPRKDADAGGSHSMGER